MARKIAAAVLAVTFIIAAGISFAKASPNKQMAAGISFANAAPSNQLAAGITTYNGEPVFKIPPLTDVLGDNAAPGEKYTGTLTLTNDTAANYKITGYTIVPLKNNITGTPRLGDAGSAAATAMKHVNSSWNIPSSGFGYVFNFDGIAGKSLSAALKSKYNVTNLLEIPRTKLLTEVFGGSPLTVDVGTGPDDITQADLDNFPNSFKADGTGSYRIVESDPEMQEFISTFISREWLQFSLDNVQYPVNFSATSTKPVFGRDYLDSTTDNITMLNNLFPVGTELLAQDTLTFNNVAISMIGQATNIVSSSRINMPFELYINLEEVVPRQFYTVVFDSMGGSNVDGISNITPGSIISPPANPVKTGYIFDGWYREATALTPWDFAVDTVNCNMTLYAKWVSADSSVPPVPSIAPPASSSAPVPSSSVPASSKPASSSKPVSSSAPISSRVSASSIAPVPSTVPSSSTAPVSSRAVSSSRASSSSTSSSRIASSSRSASSSSSASSSASDSSSGSVPVPSVAPVSGGGSEPPDTSNISNEERREEAREQLIDSGVPTLRLGNTQVPLIAGSQKFVWSLLSLMLMIGGVITSMLVAVKMLIMKRNGQQDDNRMFKLISIIIGVISLISFFILYNLSSLMVLIDIKTIFFVLFLAGELLILYFSKIRYKEENI